MSRIKPLEESQRTPALKAAFEKHVKEYNGRITNMKATLGHSELAFTVYMQWYPLYEQVQEILKDRLASFFAWSVSNASDCPLCSTYFRKVIIESGEDPDRLILNDQEKDLLCFANAIAKHNGNIADHIYNAVAKRYTAEQLVVLIAFAGQMIATNIFNNVVETEIDEYLAPYRFTTKTIAQHGS